MPLIPVQATNSYRVNISAHLVRFKETVVSEVKGIFSFDVVHRQTCPETLSCSIDG